MEQHIATIQTYHLGPTGANNNLVDTGGHNGAWGGNVDMKYITTRGWGSSSEATAPALCCVCKAALKASELVRPSSLLDSSGGQNISNNSLNK